MVFATRPSEITQRHLLRFVELISRGVDVSLAAATARIQPKLLMEVLREGEEGTDENAQEIWAAFVEATVDGHLRQLDKLDNSGRSADARWILERCWPKEFGAVYRNDVVVVHKNEGGSATAGMSAEQIRDELARGLRALETSAGATPQITMTRTTETVTVGGQREALREIEGNVIDIREDEADAEGR